MITIFNGRGLLEEFGVYANVSVSLREHLHEFRSGNSSNPLAVFLCLALHTDSNGWSATPRGVIARETGLGDVAVSSALKHLRGMTLLDKRVLAHYRKVNAGKWGSSIYLLFPETRHGNPPEGWESIAEQVNGDDTPVPEVAKKAPPLDKLYPVGHWQTELFSRLRRAYAAKGMRSPQRFQNEVQRQMYQQVADSMGESEAMGRLDYAMGAKGIISLPQIVAYLHACSIKGKKPLLAGGNGDSALSLELFQ